MESVTRCKQQGHRALLIGMGARQRIAVAVHRRLLLLPFNLDTAQPRRQRQSIDPKIELVTLLFLPEDTVFAFLPSVSATIKNASVAIASSSTVTRSFFSHSGCSCTHV